MDRFSLFRFLPGARWQPEAVPESLEETSQGDEGNPFEAVAVRRGMLSTLQGVIPRAGVVPTWLDMWLALLMVIGVLGVLAIVIGFLRGHENVFGAEQGVPWGILVSTYAFFVIAASGMCFVASLGHVFGVRRFEPLGRRAHFLAIVTLVAGFIAMAAELERPWRLFLFAFLSPNFSSAIWWMGTVYVFELMCQVTELMFLSRVEMAKKSREAPGWVAGFYRLLAVGSGDVSEEAVARNQRMARWAGVGGVITAIAATSTLGVVFGVVEAKPFWYGPFMPVYIVFSALVSGAAMLTLVTILDYKVAGREMGHEVKQLIQTLGFLLFLFLGFMAFFLLFRNLVGLYGHIPGTFESLLVLVRGPLSLPFWGLQVLAGIAVPFLILVTPRMRTVRGIGLASLLILVGLFVDRYTLVVGGQLISVIGKADVLHYLPSVTEWLIVAGVFAVWGFLYTVGERVLTWGEPD